MATLNETATRRPRAVRVPSLAEIDAEIAHRQLARDLPLVAAALDKALAEDLDDLPELVRLAARLEPTLKRQFLEAITRIKTSVDLEALEAAVRSGNFNAISEALQLDRLPAHLADTKDVLEKGFVTGGRLAAETLASNGLSLRFDVVNPRAVEWARTRSAALIVDVSDSVRESVRSTIARAFTEGRAPRETARAIRSIVGLTQRQSELVDKFYDRLKGDGVPIEKVEARTAKYAEAWLRRRGELIARTEILTASHRGQQELWQEAKAEGILDPARTRRVWLVTPDDRLCPRCEPLDAVEVGLDEPWTTRDGERVMTPPLHPACRCSTGLKIIRDRNE